MKHYIISFLAFLTITQITFAQISNSFFTKANSFFGKNVVNGLVNYQNIQKNNTELNELLQMIATAKPDKSNTAEFQAFYINAYNLLVIDGILKKYPVKSPLNINGFFDQKTHTVAGKSLTLNSIENNILRKSYPKEARFHFALVCAGLGCPPLINEAYLPSKLDAQLQRQTVKAINDNNFIKVEGKKVKISQIFEWYAQDFKQYGSYIDFLNIYRKTPIDSNAKVSFYTYNWTLNDLR